jgi:GNAT superfamily N-acetyltransferase
MVGCIDLIRGCPTSETAWLGLLLLREDHCRRGFGSAAYRELESQVRRWPRIQKIGLGVVATNSEVCAFWEKQGFRQTGDVKP